MMKNDSLEKIHDELVRKFIQYQYRTERPFPMTGDDFNGGVELYRTDAIFHQKVDRLVGGVMHTVSKYIN